MTYEQLKAYFPLTVQQAATRPPAAPGRPRPVLAARNYQSDAVTSQCLHRPISTIIVIKK